MNSLNLFKNETKPQFALNRVLQRKPRVTFFRIPRRGSPLPKHVDECRDECRELFSRLSPHLDNIGMSAVSNKSSLVSKPVPSTSTAQQSHTHVQTYPDQIGSAQALGYHLLAVKVQRNLAPKRPIAKDWHKNIFTETSDRGIVKPGGYRFRFLACQSLDLDLGRRRFLYHTVLERTFGVRFIWGEVQIDLSSNHLYI